jgi:hypothetical protein
MKTYVYLRHLAEFFSERETVYTKLVNKIKTKFRPPPPPENRAGYKLRWKNTVQSDTPQMTT